MHPWELVINPPHPFIVIAEPERQLTLQELGQDIKTWIIFWPIIDSQEVSTVLNIVTNYDYFVGEMLDMLQNEFSEA
jgi:hypothetical protein